MSTAAVTVEKLVKLEPRNLEFEKSASRAVALEGGMMAKMAQYGPRIASFLRIGGAGSFMVAGVKGFTKAEEALEAAAAIPGPLASGLRLSLVGQRLAWRQRRPRARRLPLCPVPNQ